MVDWPSPSQERAIMRRHIAILALSLLTPAASSAGYKAGADAGRVPDARALIGKDDLGEEEYKRLRDAPQTTSGDWTYGLNVDDSAGLMRQALTKQSNRGKPLLLTRRSYRDLCTHDGKPIQFYFSGDAHFALKGEPTKGRHADGWISYEDNNAFGAAIKTRLDYSEDAGAWLFTLDPEMAAARRAVSICPSPAAPGSPNGHCTIVSLNRFARAYEFVCEAK
jgi:hypothetical protein